jgi:hypothetical protein
MPLADAKVEALISINSWSNVISENGYLEPNVWYTKTDKNGAYTFDSLPIGINTTFSAVHPTDVTKTGSISFTLNTFDSTRYYLGTINVSIEPLKLVKVSFQREENNNYVYNDEVGISEPIVYAFSLPVSEAITQRMGGMPELTQGTNKISASVSFKDNTVTITPTASLDYDKQYNVTFKIYATENKFVSSSSLEYEFTYFKTGNSGVPGIAGQPVIAVVKTGAKADSVFDYKINYASVLRITSIPAGAKGYIIYAKGTTRKTDWSQITNTKISTQNSQSFIDFDLYTSNPLSDFDYNYYGNTITNSPLAGNKMSFKVVFYTYPENETGKIYYGAESAATDPIADGYSSLLDTTTAFSITGCRNLNAWEVRPYKDISMTYLKEPMDVATVPTDSISKGTAKKLLPSDRLVYQYTSPVNLRVTVIINAQDSDNYVGNRIYLKNLKDISGNTTRGRLKIMLNN